MPSTIQARLDKDTEKALEQLVRLGWTPSRVIREGVRLLAACHVTKGGRRTIIGQGEFASGIGDLATNKEHMRGFGK